MAFTRENIQNTIEMVLDNIYIIIDLSNDAVGVASEVNVQGH